MNESVLEMLDTLLERLVKANRRHVNAKADRDSVEFALAWDEIREAAHDYNTQINACDDETKAAHRVRAMETELMRQIA